MTNKSNWTGRTSRKLNEAFGLYTSEAIDKPDSYAYCWLYVLITMAISLIALFWILI